MAAPAKVVSFRLRSGNQAQSGRYEGGGSSFLDAYAELFAFQCIGVRKKTLFYVKGIGLRAGILHESAQNGRRQFQALAFHGVSGAGQDAESLRVPFKRV